MTTISFSFVRQINLCTVSCPLPLFVSSFHAVFLNYLFFFLFFTSVIAWYPVVFLVLGGLKYGSCSWGGSFSFRHSTAQPDQFDYGLWLGNYRHCGGRLQKEIQSISIYQRGSRLEESPSPRMFPFSLLIVGGIGLLEKQIRIAKTKINKNKNNIALPENSSTAR